MKRIVTLIAGLCLAYTLPAQISKEAMDVIRTTIKEYRDSLRLLDHDQQITVLQPDGKSAFCFFCDKTTSFTRNNQLISEEGKKHLLYIYPTPISEKYLPEDSIYRLTMPPGGSTSISFSDLSKNLTYKGDTVFYATPGSTPKANGHYGIYHSSGNITLLSYAWLFPDEWQPVYYKCNRKGEWKTQGNMIHFISGAFQNNFLFEIAYVRKHTIPDCIEGRPVSFVQTMNIANSNIQVIVNDPQREDGDIVSLNVNGDWKLKNLEVTNAPAKFNVDLTSSENYIALHAENLGSIPPNTAMITIVDGKNRKQIVLNSDAGKTEAILLKRAK